MTDYAIIQQNSADTAARVRLGLSALLPDLGSRTNRSGLFDDGGVVALTSGMSVSVSPFRAFIQGTSGGNQGGYFCVRDASANLTFADGGGSDRTDLVIARIYDDTYDSSGETKFAIEIVQGTGGGGVPATPANSIKLAEKVITAGMSAGSGGLGTAPVDKRPPRLVAAGGVIPVVDTTDRGTLDTYPGLTVYRIDASALEVFNGTTWDTNADSGWLTLTLASGVTDNGVTAPKYRRVGKRVTLGGYVQKSSGSWAAADTIQVSGTGAVPSGFRPPARIDFQLSGNSAASSVRGYVDSAGTVTIVTGSAVPIYVSLAAISYYVD